MDISFALATTGLGVMLIYALRMLDEGKIDKFAKNVWFWFSGLALATLMGVSSYTPVATQTTTNTTSTATATVIESDTTEITDTEEPEIDDWDALQYELEEKYNGQEYAILAIDLRNTERQIAVNADDEMPTASVYKLFTAYSILKAVEEGQDWNSPLLNTTLSNCFDKMIIDSDNDCAHAWGDTHGWQAIMNEASAIGSRIELLQDYTSTSANELAVLLQKIYNGEILSVVSREKLLSDMKTQRFRQGIPAGTPNKVVADKVGFLNGILNDAALIYGDDGDYILIILTNGYSWSSIAETARLIDETF
jgi:beta-lactamase class A